MIFICLSLHIYLPFYLYSSVYFSAKLILSIYLSIYLGIFLLIFLHICIHIYFLFIYLSFFLSIFVCLSIKLFWTCIFYIPMYYVYLSIFQVCSIYFPYLSWPPVISTQNQGKFDKEFLKCVILWVDMILL